MQRLLAFFKDARVLSFIGLVALSLVIWFGADYVKFGEAGTTLSPMARLVIIMVLIVLWGLNNLRLSQRDKRQNNQLVEQIQQSGKQQTAGVSAQEQQLGQEEAAAIQGRFQDALSKLKASKFQTRNGTKTLYELPWYIMVGPPGSGKTTAIVNSGLNFPLADVMGSSKVGGVGGTRHCDWWFTNEAVLIDTAGRYTTQDSHATADSQGWQSFLGLLKRYRPRRPVNGVIVAISVQDLIVQTREERALHAKTIRARLDELMQQLGMSFPIYVNFTKCDLISGFSEFFDDLSQAEREQVWGFTFPITANAQGLSTPGYFGGEFDALVDRLNKRLLARVNTERDVRRRQAIALFPQQFENLKQNLTDFIQETFSESRYHQQPDLRGVYFSSATQEGTPIDRIMASLSSAYGLGRESAAPQAGQGKAFFIADLLNKVIFPEAELAGINQRYERRMKTLRYAAFAAMAVVLVGSVAVWGLTVQKNRQLMAEMTQHVEAYNAARTGLGTSRLSPPDALPALNALAAASTTYEQVSHPWLSGLGLFDPDLDDASKAAYHRGLQNLLTPRLANQMEQSLKTLRSEDESLFETLRVYLMLNLVERREPPAIRNWSVASWERGLPGQATTQKELTQHLDQLLAQGFGSYPINDTVVSSARDELKRVPIEQRIYTHLKAEMMQPKLELMPALGAVDQVFRIKDPALFSVPYLYTKAGYDNVDLSATSPAVVGLTRDRWVLGTTEGEDFSEKDLENIADKVREIYLNDYANYWTKILDAVEAKPYGSLNEAVDRMTTLADPVYSPMLLLLNAVRENTTLTPEVPNVPAGGGKLASAAGDLADAVAAKALPPTVVDKRFKDLNALTKASPAAPAPIQRILTAVTNLKNSLSEITMAPDPAAVAFDRAKARFQGGSDPAQQLAIVANETISPVKGWLNTYAAGSSQATSGASKQHLSKMWGDEVCGRFSRALSGRYPFNASSRDEAALSDFIEYFKPDGVEQQFFNTYLKPFVNTSGNRWTARGGGFNISSDALQQMQLADQIRRTYFKGDGVEFAFRLTPDKLDQGVRLFELDLGGQSIRYTHGPKIPTDAQWPGSQDSVRILFQDLNETNHSKRYDGEWAFFRLLDDSDVQKGSRANSFLLNFKTDGRSAIYELTARSQSNPLNRNLLTAYRCPASL